MPAIFIHFFPGSLPSISPPPLLLVGNRKKDWVVKSSGFLTISFASISNLGNFSCAHFAFGKFQFRSKVQNFRILLLEF